MAAAPETIYDTLGEAGITRLVSLFYAQIPTDEILGPMYDPADLEAAESRLRGFLIYRFGGPDTYLQQRGNPRLRMRHAPFVITPAARDRWMQLMTHAIHESGFTPDVEQGLQQFLGDTATFLINHA